MLTVCQKSSFAWHILGLVSLLLSADTIRAQSGEIPIEAKVLKAVVKVSMVSNEGGPAGQGSGFVVSKQVQTTDETVVVPRAYS